MPVLDLTLIGVPLAAVSAGAVGILSTGLFLGFRHGFDWDHIAAITDITSTSAAADAATGLHDADHHVHPHDHGHPHGGRAELTIHEIAGAPGGAAASTMSSLATVHVSRPRFMTEERHSIVLGTLYALGHAAVVLALGLLAIAFGTLLPDWVDPIMGRVVGFTLLFLGIWVFVSLWQYLRSGKEFRLRSRWMLVFDGARYSWRRLQARFHGHAHVEPLEMSSYGYRTAFGVGMIHGIGAETGSQALLIAAVGGAAGTGLGIPMLARLRRRAGRREHRDRGGVGDRVRSRPGPPTDLHRHRRAGRRVQHRRRSGLHHGHRQPAPGPPAAAGRRCGASATRRRTPETRVAGAAGRTSRARSAPAASAGRRSGAW